MFSRTAEKVLNSAAREAVTRRHAHLTLEHLLFAILSEPSGERSPGAWYVVVRGTTRRTDVLIAPRPRRRPTAATGGQRWKAARGSGAFRASPSSGSPSSVCASRSRP